ncbi:hypothetical protein [Ponticaulis sp.]|uniref:hypothetical protein n=1 Tax=Ponticaulis sp. TaxID=2020902 RepID=UPI000B6C704E|nr:hypothetical protein [Ponticaulis sp.]MAI91165.1 hypothetical protein [Ponticaulis sp.]OUX98479.1 MAG: hypothetical protein CBB65_12020 [Hyphomonadaceae bacterium TMED5]|tara:strand:- start:130312 stop:130938 length:627 start_codon:yes stop_codon:yes gene_type:complete
MGKGNKAEMLIAICAVISSIAAVYIAWDQARVMRSQEKADVWPIVQLLHHTGYDHGGFQYRFGLENAGVGPALIQGYIIHLPGEENTTSFRDMVSYFVGEEIMDNFSEPNWADQSVRSRVMRQGTQMNAIEVEWQAEEGLQDVVEAHVSPFIRGERPPAEVFVCYCSILDDCWVATTLQSNPTPTEVRSCEALPGVMDQLLSQTSSTD